MHNGHIMHHTASHKGRPGGLNEEREFGEVSRAELSKNKKGSTEQDHYYGGNYEV